MYLSGRLNIFDYLLSVSYNESMSNIKIVILAARLPEMTMSELFNELFKIFDLFDSRLF